MIKAALAIALVLSSSGILCTMIAAFTNEWVIEDAGTKGSNDSAMSIRFGLFSATAVMNGIEISIQHSDLLEYDEEFVRIKGILDAALAFMIFSIFIAVSGVVLIILGITNKNKDRIGIGSHVITLAGGLTAIAIGVFLSAAAIDLASVTREDGVIFNLSFGFSFAFAWTAVVFYLAGGTCGFV